MAKKKLGNISLTPEQLIAANSMKTGSLLVGGVGSGKTYTSIFWAESQPQENIYVITTAAKRDKIEPGHIKPDWQESLDNCGITNYIVDSWNNIKKYEHVSHGLFLFDEQRVVGYGTWSKTFIKIAHNNNWVLLSATPGDSWDQYIPVFIANGFYRNKTEFSNEHIEYDRFAKYPKIKAFHGTSKLNAYRKRILVPMTVPRSTIRNRHNVICKFDSVTYKDIEKNRWNPYTNLPINTASEYTQVLRRLVASDESRIKEAYTCMMEEPKLIIFYNYNYERDILIDLCNTVGKPWAEYNGHNHQPIPDEPYWIYLVQYTAGAEGWNCIQTDTMMFYSPNYSYKIMEQSEGRIDRLNTPFIDLHYIYLKSNSKIDRAVLNAIANKKRFNESAWDKQVSDYFKNDKPSTKRRTNGKARSRISK